MCYISRDTIVNTLENMKSFYDDMNSLFDKYGMDFEENSGRRNIVMSHAQEKMLADQLKKFFHNVISDGKTGQPDIIIEHEGTTRELECKITTPTASLSLQTDYETLARKGKLDYIYFIVNNDFTEYAVLFFDSLTVDDFRSPSPGSRGKSSMVKHKAFKKCTPLFGSIEDIKRMSIERCNLKLKEVKPTQKSKKKRIEKSLKYWLQSDGRFSVKMEKVA